MMSNSNTIEVDNLTFDLKDELCHGEFQNVKEAQEEPLSWRLEKSDSLSDWTIVVKIQNQNTDNDDDLEDGSEDAKAATNIKTDEKSMTTARTYHVHKCFLAAGPQKSAYFATLLKKTQSQPSSFAEVKNSTSCIELEKGAADAFPIVLDFIYNMPDVCNQITTHNAVALRYLAKFFHLGKLFTVITAFIRKDIKPETISIYLSEALKYHDDNLIQFATDICAKTMDDIKLEDLISFVPSIFQQIMTSDKLSCKDTTRTSYIVHLYCKNNMNGIDSEFLNAVTDCENMSSIDPDIAGSLLNLYNFHCKNNEIMKESTQNPEVLQSGDLNEKKSLEERCIKALASCWEDKIVEVNRQEESGENEERTGTTTRKYDIFKDEKFPPHIQIKLLERSLIKAKEKLLLLGNSQKVPTATTSSGGSNMGTMPAKAVSGIGKTPVISFHRQGRKRSPAPPTRVPTGISFGAAKSIQDAKGGFSLNGGSFDTKGGFSLSGGSFDAKAIKRPAGAFLFRGVSSATKSAAAPAAGLSFGKTNSAAKSSNSPGAGFSFGSRATKSAAAPAAGLSFGEANSAAKSSNSPGAGFSFGSSCKSFNADFVDAMDEKSYVVVELTKPMGVVFEENDSEFGGICVKSLIEDGAAAKNGVLKVGDQLVAVDTTDVCGQPIDALNTIDESKGETTKLIFFRGKAKQFYGPTGANKSWLEEFIAKGGVEVTAPASS